MAYLGTGSIYWFPLVVRKTHEHISATQDWPTTIVTIALCQLQFLTGRHRLLGAHKSRLGTRDLSSGCSVIRHSAVRWHSASPFRIESGAFLSTLMIYPTRQLPITASSEPIDATDIINTPGKGQQHPRR